MARTNPEAYEREDLKRDLKSRHIQMIAIGGAIGTGLFYGSGWAVKTAGPAIILTYVVAAVAIYFVMRAPQRQSGPARRTRGGSRRLLWLRGCSGLHHFPIPSIMFNAVWTTRSARS